MSLRTLLIVGLALIFTSGLAISCKEDADPPASDATSPGGDGPGSKDQSTLGDIGPTGDGPPATGEAAKTLEALAQLEKGQPADLDGDGTPDTTLTAGAGGAFTLEHDWNGDKVPEFVMQSTPDKSSSMTVDNNIDGKADFKSASTVGPPTVRVLDEDGDFNGTFDRRMTVTYDLKAQTRRIVVEEDPDEDGTYTQVSDDTVPLSVAVGGGGCDGHDGFPKNTGGPSRKFGSIVIPYGGGGGRCSGAEADRLLGAVQWAMGEGKKCLNKTNPEAGDKLFAALRRSSLIVGCGNTCAGQYAAMNSGWFFTPHLNTNSGLTPNLSDKQLQSVMLHELLHWAGEETDAKDHDNGEDRIYACGRYCGGCNAIGPGASQGSSVDCAKCAKTLADKAACGQQDKLVQIKHSVALCHQGFTNAQCKQYMGWQKQACDGTPLSGTPPLSCCICDAKYTKNDKPCSGPDTKKGTCDKPPPGC